jgi:hypothetical protein
MSAEAGRCGLLDVLGLTEYSNGFRGDLLHFGAAIAQPHAQREWPTYSCALLTAWESG